MKNRRCLVAALIMGGLFAVILVVAGALSIYLINRGLDAKREASTPPAVFVHSPNDGETVQAGDSLLADVSASGVNPIARLEMWLDGELVETQTPDPAIGEGTLNFQALFDLLLSEGTHMLHWRVVDNAGLVGQSQAVTVVVLPVPTGGEDQAAAADEPPAPVDPGEPPQPPPGDAPAGPGEQPQPQGGGSTSVQPGDVKFPEELPVTPPGVPPLYEVTIPVVDIGSLISNLLSNMPKAPSNLQAGFEDCKVRLVWYDNADNETSFNIWMQRLGGPPQLIKTVGGSPSTGPAWIEFKAPGWGVYGFWVEAVNGFGSQPSELKGLVINDASCPQDVLATKLVIEALDMHISGGFDEVYCYLSLEGAAAQRIPGGTDYIQVLNQWGDITKHWGGEKRILLPIPFDEEVSLEGECLGMVSGGSVSLGRFQESVPRAQWNGERLAVDESQFKVGYRIYYLGSEQAQGLYGYVDNGILQPTNLHMKVDTASDPVANAKLGRRPDLHWTWKGDPGTITGFNVLLEGEFYRWADPEYNWTRVPLPTSCGGVYNLQVVAVSGEAQSVPSPVLFYEQPPWEIYAEVILDSFIITAFNDGILEKDESPGCDIAELIFDIAVDGIYREFGNDERSWRKGCGTHPFRNFQQTGGDKSSGDANTFIIPIDPSVKQIVIKADFRDWDFNEYLIGDEKDFFCLSFAYLPFPYENGANVDYTQTIPCPSPGATATGGFDGKGSIVVRVRGISSPEGP
jgi:hypothetical protein